MIQSTKLMSFKSLPWVVLAFLLQTTGASAHPPIHSSVPSLLPVLAQRFELAPGESTSVILRDWMHIQKLFVQAEGRSCATTVEVMVNGDVKGTLYLPGRDPSYVVTVAESTGSIELRNVGECGAIFRDIRAQVRGLPLPMGRSWPSLPGVNSPISAEAHGVAAQIAAETIGLVDELRAGASLAESSDYLLPIKKVAARLYAVANARSDTSRKVYVQLVSLKGQIDFAANYLDRSFERDTQFEAAVRLLGVRERIEAIVQ